MEFNYQKIAFKASLTEFSGGNVEELRPTLLRFGWDDLTIERGTLMARGKESPLLCIHNGNWLRVGEDGSFKVMRPDEKATYVPIQSADELRAENDMLRAELDAMKSQEPSVRWRCEISKYHISLVAELRASGMLEAAAVIENSETEIDRLNAQVAMLAEGMRYLMDWQVKNVAVWHNNAYDNASRILKQKQPEIDEWLADHDAKVRDDALEEAALRFDEHCMEVTANEIRAMKGAK